MFDIGFAELLIVAVVALIVLGPERLPTALRTLGLWLGRIRRSVGNIQREISEELRLEEVKQAAREQQNLVNNQMENLQKPFGDSLRDEILAPGPESAEPVASKSAPVPDEQSPAAGSPSSAAPPPKPQASTDL